MNESSKKVLDAIIDYKLEHDGNAPTYSEMKELTGLSRSTCFQHVYKLVGLKYLRVADSKICLAAGYWTFGAKDENAKPN